MISGVWFSFHFLNVQTGHLASVCPNLVGTCISVTLSQDLNSSLLMRLLSYFWVHVCFIALLVWVLNSFCNTALKWKLWDRCLCFFPSCPPRLCGLGKSLYECVCTKQMLLCTVFIVLRRRVQQNSMWWWNWTFALQTCLLKKKEFFFWS